MDAEHDDVADALAGARAAMVRLKASASATDAEAAKAAMTRLQEVTVSHFGRRLTPAKGGRFIAWMLDGASDEAKAAVIREIPGPVVTIIGGIFGMPYRRKIAPVWKT